MNNGEDVPGCEPGRRIRLLTFDTLPFTDDLSATESFYDAVDQLSARAVCFENHYLQQPGLASISGSVSMPWNSTKHTPPGRFVLLSAAQQPRSIDPLLIPAALSTEVVDATSTDWLSVVSITRDDPFAWIHVESPKESGNGSEFESALPLMEALCDRSSIVIVTSLAAAPRELAGFETRLSESCIRAPLWLLGVANEGRRVQAVTGSFDIALTVEEALKHDSNVAPLPESGNAAINLVQLAKFPGSRVSRELMIAHDDASAVRTNEFLFVQSRHGSDVDFTEYDTALYAKPEDVWNVNDVSSEFHDIVDRLRQRLS